MKSEILKAEDFKQYPSDLSRIIIDDEYLVCCDFGDGTNDGRCLMMALAENQNGEVVFRPNSPTIFLDEVEWFVHSNDIVKIFNSEKNEKVYIINNVEYISTPIGTKIEPKDWFVYRNGSTRIPQAGGEYRRLLKSGWVQLIEK